MLDATGTQRNLPSLPGQKREFEPPVWKRPELGPFDDAVDAMQGDAVSFGKELDTAERHLKGAFTAINNIRRQLKST